MTPVKSRRAVCAALVSLAVTVAQAQQSSNAVAAPQSVTATAPTPAEVTTIGGTKGNLPFFDSASTLVNSNIYQYNGGIGIGRVPNATLDVGGATIFRGNGIFSRSSQPTTATGANSFFLTFQAAAYNSAVKNSIYPYFAIQSEPTGNNTATTGAALHFLYFSGFGSAPSETGLSINPDGTFHFAPGQTFPGASGTVGPAGPAGPVGPAGPAGQSGALTLPYATKANGNGGYLFSLTNTGKAAGGGLYASGETGAVVDSGAPTYAGPGVTGQGGLAASSYAASGGTGVAGTGGNSSAADQSTGGFGVVGTGGPAVSANSKGGVGGQFTGGAGSNGGGFGVIAIGGAGNVASQGGSGLFAQPGTNGRYAAEFQGDVAVFGNLFKSGGSFKIDDPEDPANKYLSHSFVESPDMMNIYNGNVVTDADGNATVQMPSWFESLNRDFRYQLTTIGGFAQATIASEINDGKFSIKTDRGNVKISWQVTGVRQDAWANAHRIPVEQEKSTDDKGHYLHPELYGHPEEAGIVQRSHPPAAFPQ